MTFSVKETFYTLQGEGANAGRPAVFCRFSGCNLWSGLERDRAQAICRFCDTDFVGTNGAGGGKFRTAKDLAAHVQSFWPAAASAGAKLVVCTGGEPALQMTPELVAALHDFDFEIAIETNGTLALPDDIDWVCVSPKAGTELAVRSGQELKVIYPQAGLDLQQLITLPFRHHLLQPMDGPSRQESEAASVQACLDDPRWRLSVQTHKYLGFA
ncbi:7-carboxy-7-deazaguanine synthase [Alphaproteobacteria bacterium]|jgi:7-carboxy-7-deazaguanine synthase (Cx14CxxC type)|nr:7-carboxy-7-deazaguanine synthase [Alphaproteobacteria bacterium]|tara:strand:+ start:1243 stop:1881 length:639 start_codon:yes stop_codon:yes gene_type:complete